MMLGTKARYAVMALVDMAKRNENTAISLANLAETQEIPLPYLEQIFAKLRKAGLVESVRGPGGGYKLAKTAENLSVAAIVEAVEESVQMTRCSKHDVGGCLAKNTRCLTHDFWEGLEDHISSYLQSVSLQDICSRQLPSNHR